MVHVYFNGSVSAGCVPLLLRGTLRGAYLSPQVLLVFVLNCHKLLTQKQKNILSLGGANALKASMLQSWFSFFCIIYISKVTRTNHVLSLRRPTRSRCASAAFDHLRRDRHFLLCFLLE